VAATKWLGLWELDLGCSADSLQFHGGSGVGKRTGCIDENPAMAAPPLVCSAGGARRVFWLHDCFWSSRAWRFDAARLANTLELPDDAGGAALRGFVPDFARADDSHGFDTAGDH